MALPARKNRHLDEPKGEPEVDALLQELNHFFRIRPDAIADDEQQKFAALEASFYSSDQVLTPVSVGLRPENGRL